MKLKPSRITPKRKIISLQVSGNILNAVTQIGTETVQKRDKISYREDNSIGHDRKR